MISSLVFGSPMAKVECVALRLLCIVIKENRATSRSEDGCETERDRNRGRCNRSLLLYHLAMREMWRCVLHIGAQWKKNTLC